MNVYDCQYEYNGYTQNVAADSEWEAEQMVRDEAEDYKEEALDNDFRMRDLVRDINVTVKCEVSEYEDDPTKAQNYDERRDEVTDELVY